MKENIKSDLKTIISSFGEAIDKEEQEEYNKNYKSKMQDIDLSNFDNWELFLYEQESMNRQHILSYYDDKYKSFNKDKIVFYYNNYLYLTQNVEKMIDLGRGASYDKATFVLEKYLAYQVEGKEVEFPKYEDKAHSYYHPDFGTFKEWVNFIDSLISLYYGYYDLYLTCLENFARQKANLVEQMEQKKIRTKKYLKRYQEIIQKNKDQFTEKEYHFITLYLENALFQFINEIDEETVTESEIIAKTKEIYNDKK